MKTTALKTWFYMVGCSSTILSSPLSAQNITTDLAGPTHCGNYQTEPVKIFHRVVWKTQLDGWGLQNGIIHGNTLYVSANRFDPSTKALTGYIFAVRSEDGTILWRDSVNQNISSPVLKDNTLFCGSDAVKGKQFAFNAENGKLLWTVPTAEASCYPPAIDGNSNFFGSHGRRWYEVDNSTGTVIKETETESGICCSASVQDGIIYYVDWGGLLHAYNHTTGKDQWTFHFEGKSFSAPSIDKGIAYFVSEEGTIYAVDIKTGKQVWSFKTDDSLYRSPAINNGIAVLISTNGHIYAFNTSDGSVLWDARRKGKNNWPAYTHPAIAKDVVYTGCSDGFLYAFELSTGKELWNYETGVPVGTPFADHGRLYFTSGPFVYAIE